MICHPKITITNRNENHGFKGLLGYIITKMCKSGPLSVQLIIIFVISTQLYFILGGQQQQPINCTEPPLIKDNHRVNFFSLKETLGVKKGMFLYTLKVLHKFLLEKEKQLHI